MIVLYDRAFGRSSQAGLIVLNREGNRLALDFLGGRQLELGRDRLDRGREVFHGNHRLQRGRDGLGLLGLLGFLVVFVAIKPLQGVLGRCFHALHDPPPQIQGGDERQEDAHEQADEGQDQAHAQFFDVFTEAHRRHLLFFGEEVSVAWHGSGPTEQGRKNRRKRRVAVETRVATASPEAGTLAGGTASRPLRDGLMMRGRSSFPSYHAPVRQRQRSFFVCSRSRCQDAGSRLPAVAFGRH